MQRTIRKVAHVHVSWLRGAATIASVAAIGPAIAAMSNNVTTMSIGGIAAVVSHQTAGSRLGGAVPVGGRLAAAKVLGERTVGPCPGHIAVRLRCLMCLRLWLILLPVAAKSQGTLWMRGKAKRGQT